MKSILEDSKQTLKSMQFLTKQFSVNIFDVTVNDGLQAYLFR